MEDWRQRRTEAAAAHAAAAARAHEQETARARALLTGFREALQRNGIEPVRLRARAGSARYRTDVTGWYLRRDGSLGLGVDGAYYVLDVSPGLRSRLAGVRLLPADPPLQVGRGARDGESVELVELLRLRSAELGVD